MTTKEIYELAVKMGMKSDLRGPLEVKKYLERAKNNYNKLDRESKKYFDKEKLENPYSDTRILVDNKKKKINKVMVGIDIDGAEFLLADRMGDIDLAISHHPDGKALADLHSVMDLQARVLADYGVPINIAESVIKPRISEVGRSVHPVNHNKVVDIARVLKIDYMCTHTIADNLGANFLVKLIKRKKPETVEDVMDVLDSIPEYKQGRYTHAGPKIFVGRKDNSCGKVVVTEFTGGTSGAKEIYEKMAQYGIGTIVGMHMKEDYRKEAEKYHINVVIAGHIASDSLGMNLFLDQIEKKGIQILTVGGLLRIKR